MIWDGGGISRAICPLQRSRAKTEKQAAVGAVGLTDRRFYWRLALGAGGRRQSAMVNGERSNHSALGTKVLKE